jgi:hypothetical protein
MVSTDKQKTLKSSFLATSFQRAASGGGKLTIRGIPLLGGGKKGLPS